VTLSGDINLLLSDGEMVEEAEMEIPEPIPLLELGNILQAVQSESPKYNLKEENCWFLTAVIQEIFMLYHGAYFVNDAKLNNQSFGEESRDRIKARLKRAGKHPETPSDTMDVSGDVGPRATLPS